jgi:hypothetical protein
VVKEIPWDGDFNQELIFLSLLFAYEDEGIKIRLHKRGLNLDPNNMEYDLDVWKGVGDLDTEEGFIKNAIHLSTQDK